jgi:hypothetical protein
MPRGRSAAALAVALLLLSGCARDTPPNQPRVTVHGGRAPSSITIDGFSTAARETLAARSGEAQAWQDVVRVEIATSAVTAHSLPPMAGTFAVEGALVRFTPAFPFEPGARYRVRVDAAKLPGGAAAPVTFDFDVAPAVVAAQAAKVTGVSPGSARLPENLLRMYVHFSAPMGREGGARHVRLLDAAGREIEDVFLPLDADLWNADHTRYTLLLDPGRVKTGITPNEQMGRALVAGKPYTLVVDATWHDAAGRPLDGPFRHTFRAGPALETAIDPMRWRVEAPRAGTRQPLAVTFPHPMDEALALRAIGVESASGAVDGRRSLDAAAVTWTFVPERSWMAGAYHVIALGILEDPSGNRIGRRFELAPSDTSREVERASVPFMIAP